VSAKLWPAIVSVADRLDVPPFFETVSVTLAVPVPDAPEDTTAHDTGLLAVQLQPSAAVTSTDTVPPDTDAVAETGEIEYEHGADARAAAAWTTVKFHPPASMAPLRIAVLVFEATLNDTAPGPVVEAPAVTVSHPAWLTAVH